jgi:hypothetical protein
MTEQDINELIQKVSDRESGFKVYHELMAWKVRRILLVSSPYDAWILEEDGRLSERIINEYRGLNLSHPPQFVWVSTAEQALKKLDEQNFQMVITMPRIVDMDVRRFAETVKSKKPDISVILISHSNMVESPCTALGSENPLIDRTFVWSGNTDLLVAIVKSEEDRHNIKRDVELAQVRMILFIENSPVYISSILPILYKELVGQTRNILGRRLNEEHRLLVMRARPKILIAETFEEAKKLYDEFSDVILGVISDVEFPRNRVLDPNAGIDFLKLVREDRFDIPLLLTSVNQANKARAEELQAGFANKTSPRLHERIHDFFIYNLAFGDFIFKTPDERVVGHAGDLQSLEKALAVVPLESVRFHAQRNDFSRWLFTRTETMLGGMLRDIQESWFDDPEEMRRFLIDLIHAHRRARQQGVVVDFAADDVDLMTNFFKLGKGSLGGKARGLAFFHSLLRSNRNLLQRFPNVLLNVPQTLVISTEVFDDFIDKNHLDYLADEDYPDAEIVKRFRGGTFPGGAKNDLRAFLHEVRYPLAVRSSSLLEDAQFQAYAGLYSTYMLPNNQQNDEVRLEHLIAAIKQVYASTYFRDPKAFSRRIGRRVEEEKMAVIVQRLVGERYGNYFYPAISGVAQSFNYYPFSRMKPEDGIATIVLGMGRAVVLGERALRFCPKFPALLPQQSTLDGVLQNAQYAFYALEMRENTHSFNTTEAQNLVRRTIEEADEPPVAFLSSTYIPSERRIRDSVMLKGHRVLTFANVLKYNRFPLAAILEEVLSLGRDGMGAQVEMEFSVNLKLAKQSEGPPEFAFLQLRPMTARAELGPVTITREERARAHCYATHALGHFVRHDVRDIVFVKPESFDVNKTIQIAAEISQMNMRLVEEDRPYLLIGPGRWGTADRWLGIPVHWADISGVAAIVEAVYGDFQVEPSQGSHFFHNITSQGIGYINISGREDESIDWPWLRSLPVVDESPFVVNAQVQRPLTMKVDGHTHACVLLEGR